MTATAVTTGRNTAVRTNHSRRDVPSSSSASARPMISAPTVCPMPSSTVCPSASVKRRSRSTCT
ncbi:hypothetical protein BC477_03290 [Clavibacter michiganensis subsp. michiganensis]|uniref:Uncharacterized protein n=1 Tax=Clavibacter michiganensis subsp. michiganensis TaxID=33013 RepID=A0A251XJW3_CLAMM|nr:hypothetical protein BC477_03290 [Clavibacter michiganensis subsp. michiganensis]OUE03737.1 hypothetical protein CMMCAS07_02225 [Clavibacter michiganensis subsp. michiganensis]